MGNLSVVLILQQVNYSTKATMKSLVTEYYITHSPNRYKVIHTQNLGC
jgi:hypothetical protein